MFAVKIARMFFAIAVLILADIPSAIADPVNMQEGLWGINLEVGSGNKVQKNQFNLCISAEETQLEPYDIAMSLTQGMALGCSHDNLSQSKGKLSFDLVCPNHIYKSAKMTLFYAEKEFKLDSTFYFKNAKGPSDQVNFEAVGQRLGNCNAV